MRRAICILMAICMSVVICTLSLIGCGEKEFVDTSNAVSRNSFDNPDFAKEQEANDDAAGREHISIPDDAETITIDGEQYIPIDNMDDISYVDYDKNFILKHDIDIRGKGCVAPAKVLSPSSTSHDIPFTGKFNGNNYKVYGERGWVLFGYIKDAEISNLIFSSEMISSLSKTAATGMVLCGIAENSTIKNITNYSTLGRKDQATSLGLILYLYKSTLENVINYGDVVEGSACIVKYMFDSTVKNCKNYGSISYKYQYPIGGIVSEILAHHIPVLASNGEATATVGSVVENCENYGNIIGTSYVGGIVGRVAMYQDAHTIGLTYGQIFYDYFTDISKVKLLSNPSVIKNCTNYGNLYRDKDYEHSTPNLTVMCCVGGITGLGYQIENCKNNGNIYGFEVVNPEYTVDYIGGITGAAVNLSECTSSTKLVAASSINHTNDICGYTIER
ncbi:MAG: hypothetical protein K2M89_04140 [Clostridiales bacterium]|nr:hypothetical protein [Clostridiales bacterium]